MFQERKKKKLVNMYQESLSQIDQMYQALAEELLMEDQERKAIKMMCSYPLESSQFLEEIQQEFSRLIDAFDQKVMRSGIHGMKTQYSVGDGGSSPFFNNGSRFESDAFILQAYCWEETPRALEPNFLFYADDSIDVEDAALSWYKHFYRGLCCSEGFMRAVKDGKLPLMVDKCIEALDRGGDWEPPFPTKTTPVVL